MARPIDLRIEAVGDVPPDVLAELEGFEADLVAGTTRLSGSVVDGAALWGVLHRLHRAGLGLRSVQRISARNPSTHRPEPDHPAPRRSVRIEVEGQAAGVISGAVTCTEVTQTPPSTTLTVHCGDEDALFEVLAVLEGLALEVRRIQVD